MCSTGELLDLLYHWVERVVGQVRGLNVGECGADRHVAKGDLATLGKLAVEEESQSGVLLARAVRSVGNEWHRLCAFAVCGKRDEICEAQLFQGVHKADR